MATEPSRVAAGSSQRLRSVDPPVSGLAALWAETAGDSRIVIGILDAPIDLENPCLRSAAIDQLWFGDHSRCSSHGTEVASVILAPHDSSVLGVAPGCRARSVPIYDCDPGRLPSTDQRQLAVAIQDAVAAGAHIINVSAGQFSLDGAAEPELIEATRACEAAGVLIVAAAGNDGCDCLHVPAALPCVLSVGAMQTDGRPSAQSNWGSTYQRQGILAPGENISVAGKHGNAELRTGTSYATAIVSGVAALLLSREFNRGRPVRPLLIRKALLTSATVYDGKTCPNSRQLLAGRLNIAAATRLLDQWSSTMNDAANADLAAECNFESTSRPATAAGGVQPNGDRSFEARKQTHTEPQAAPEANPYRAGETVQPSACAACRGERQLVYAIGQLNYDFGNEACLDGFRQRMRHLRHPTAEESHGKSSLWHEAEPLNKSHMLTFFKTMREQRSPEPWHASVLQWTLEVGDVPLYVIRPEGPFAAHAYELLERYFREQISPELGEPAAERVAVPGLINGQATLLNGRQVPVINPDLRGFYNWETKKLIEAAEEAVAGFASRQLGDELAEQQAQAGEPAMQKLRHLARQFLHRIYFELRNAGRTPQERALNFAATNLVGFYEGAEFVGFLQRPGSWQDNRALDTIRVERSPIGRPGSDCWDITLAFFDPDNAMQAARWIHRYTIDVSDVIPIFLGQPRSWRTL